MVNKITGQGRLLKVALLILLGLSTQSVFSTTKQLSNNGGAELSGATELAQMSDVSVPAVPASARESAPSSKPSAPVPGPGNTGPLLKDWLFWQPLSIDFCDEQPDLLGQIKIKEGEILLTGDCFGIAVQVRRQAKLFLISKDALGTYTLLSPLECNVFGSQQGSLEGGEIFRLPSFEGTGGMLRLDEKTGTESFFLILAESPEAGSAAAELASQVNSACGKMAFNPPADLKAALEDLAANYEGLEWHSFSFEHR